MNTAPLPNRMADKNTWAIVAVSRDATALALRVKDHLDDYKVTVYTKEKYMREGTQAIGGSMADFMGQLMADHEIILCIMATGIVVRSIAPHLGHKSADPGILVMDAAGKYVISLLSGHLGGANEAAVTVSKRMGAQAVITTGTDVKGSMAVDVLAQKLECTIDDFTQAKEVTALILDGDTVVVEDRVGCDFTGIILPHNLLLEGDGIEIPATAGKIIIATDRADTVGEGCPWALLVPKNVVVGIGCKRAMDGEHIIEALKGQLAQAGIHPKAVKTLATIGLKAEEPGIKKACESFGAALKIVPDDFVKMVQGRF